MEKREFIGLLKKYQAGSETKEELDFIISYYNLFQSEPEILSLLTVEQREELKRTIQEKIWNSIDRKEKVISRTAPLRILKIGSAAVAAAVLIILSVRVFHVQNVTVRPVAVSAQSENALLNRAISLPDGTMVTLSPGSTLQYPPAFSSNVQREVTLNGQAYFDVKHDESRPFVVRAGKLNVRVLGTAFNVNASNVEANIVVTVKRGKVRVGDAEKIFGTIVRREQITYNKQNNQSLKQTITNENYLDWIKQDCSFDNMTMPEVASLIGDRFGVTIIIDKQVANSEKFTATLSKNETLDQALKSICEFNNAKYAYSTTKGTVYIEKR